MSYNKEEISAKFKKGKTLLDRGYYNESTEIFTELINITDSLKDSNTDARLTCDVSLNNRGIVKCKVAYSSENSYKSFREQSRFSVCEKIKEITKS